MSLEKTATSEHIPGSPRNGAWFMMARTTVQECVVRKRHLLPKLQLEKASRSGAGAEGERISETLSVSVHIGVNFEIE
jgi:hypothetical protein